MFSNSNIKDAFAAALPIMLGYMAIGLPCGLLASSIGLNWLQVLLMSLFFYSGAGQFMIPNLFLAGTPIASIVASVSLVNTRQMLYSASLSPRCAKASKPLSFLFAATVTDESFGVNIAKFEEGSWSVKQATLVNLFSQASWTLFNVIGVLIGGVLNVPLAVASFAMTSIFICLMCTQTINVENVAAMVAAMIGVVLCKWVGLGKLAIVIGAILGVAAACAIASIRDRRKADTAECAADSECDVEHACPKEPEGAENTEGSDDLEESKKPHECPGDVL